MSTSLRAPTLACLTGLLGSLFCAACGDARNTVPGERYREYGDLPELRRRGELRILLPPQQARLLPRRGDTVDLDLRLARQLARQLNLSPVLIMIEDRSELLGALAQGRGDLAIARLTATEARRKMFGFSVPVDHVREILVVRAGDERIQLPEDLDGVEVAVRESSSFFDTLTQLREQAPGVRILRVDERLDTEEILYRVGRGEYEATMADEDLLREVMSYRPDLRAAFPLTDARPIAWAMRPGSEQLKQAVDGFLHQRALTGDREERLVGDLDSIRERKVVRVLTRNNAATYFLYRGKQLGFEFELAHRFASQIGCRLQIIVPPTADLLIPWLLEGRGDLVAASMTVTPERQASVVFSRPYNFVQEVVVVRVDDGISKPADLAGRKISVRRSSAYYESLRELQREVGFVIVVAAEDQETEELIAMVGDGTIDVTVADSNILDIELTHRDDVRGAFVLGETKTIAWAMRPGAEQTEKAVNDFLEGEYRGEFYNVIRSKYFGDSPRVARRARSRAARDGRVSPYDDLFREYGKTFEIDWRLLAAQAYTESEFDPRAESWAGAQGLMQVMPQTAEQLGIGGDLRDPKTSIRAGAEYLRYLVDQFEPALPFAERLRFALGSYNAGLGHIQDGRRLAREHGFDPDRWFGNVESVLPLLARAAYASQARYGYCRCLETQDYVRQVNDHYVAYSSVIE